MRYCFNPDCTQPVNDQDGVCCVNCGSPLVLRDRYVASRVMGHKGFCKMFFGVDLQRGPASCCIKQLLPRDLNGVLLPSHIKSRFGQEASELGKLGGDPQFPILFEFFTEGSSDYLVLEYIEGDTLSSLLQRSAIVYNEEQLMEFLRQMLSMLQKLHQAGVVQRDIKPDNIMLRNGVYVLTDFGGSRLIESTVLSGPTPSQVAYANDIYSVGVTCLILLTGKRPEDLLDAFTGTWRWRSLLGQNTVSSTLASVLDRMVAPPFGERFESVQAVNATLYPSTPSLGKTVIAQAIPVTRSISGALKEKRKVIVIALLAILAVPVLALTGFAVKTAVNKWQDSRNVPAPVETPEPPKVQQGVLDNDLYRYEGEYLGEFPQGEGEKITKKDGTREKGRFEKGAFVSGLRTTNGINETGTFQDGLLHTEKGERIYANGEKEIGSFELGNLTKGEKILADGAKLTGSFQGGKLTGEGVYISPAGDRYEGNFVSNRLQGSAKVTFRTGAVWEGQFRDGQLSGKGKIVSASGEVQEGNFWQNKLSGKGKITSNRGTWVGEFENGKLNGQGKFTGGGEVKEGYFKDNKLNGQGKYTKDGEVKEGYFQNDQLSGTGKLTYKGSTWEGTFRDDQLHGEGKVSFADGWVSEGYFQNGELNGRGSETHPKGERLEGTFSNGRLNGEGKITFANGDVYKGEFKNNRLNGQGTQTLSNGWVYEGEFRDEKLNGRGKVITPSGEVHEGEFANDKLHGRGRITVKGRTSLADGAVVTGTFEDGKLIGEGRVRLPIGLEYKVKGDTFQSTFPLVDKIFGGIDGISRRGKSTDE